LTARRPRNRALRLESGLALAALLGLGACAPPLAAPPAPGAGLGPPAAAARAGPAGPTDCVARPAECAAAPEEPLAGEDGELDPESPEEEGEVDDGLELPDPAPDAAPGRPPLADLTDAQIERKLQQDPASLGSMSLGYASSGALFNGVPMPAGERWNRIDAGHAWGTKETVDALVRCIDAVHAQFEGTPKMHIGHISAKGGGPLFPHISHQAGRDVDIGYFLVTQDRWFQRANAKNLDAARTWAFVRALLIESDVELILVDTGVQRLLKDHALAAGEDRAWLDDVFQVGSRSPRPIIRHAKGHADHLHIRFYNPVAQELGRRAYPLLIKRDLIKPPTYYVQHKAKKGDTLGSLANRYGTTTKAIQEANGLRGTRIAAKRTYRIPKAGGIKAPPGRIVVPPRRLPPKAGPAQGGTTSSKTLNSSITPPAVSPTMSQEPM
jgi:murein endopeptidase